MKANGLRKIWVNPNLEFCAHHLNSIEVDEISYYKGHKYDTVVYDLDRSCVVSVGRGKGRETIDIFFNEMLNGCQKSKIKWACYDMAETYIRAIEDHSKRTPVSSMG